MSLVPHTVLGGWYGDAVLDPFRFACFRPDLNVIEFAEGARMGCPPDDGVLWLVVAANGDLAGQSQRFSDRSWLYTNGKWERTTPACGKWPVIFNSEKLLISNCAPPVFADGYRYINPVTNVVVLGQDTLIPLHGINEWTDLSLTQDRSVVIGQDNAGRGLAVWINSALRILTPGFAMNVRGKANASGQVAISCYIDNGPGRPTEFRAFDTSFDELRTLSPVGVKPPTHEGSSPAGSQGDFVMIDPKTVILYARRKSSSRTGCTNYIRPDGLVVSCQRDGSLDTRPAGTDGPWEQFQETGSLATVNVGGLFYCFGLAPVDKVL